MKKQIVSVFYFIALVVFAAEAQTSRLSVTILDDANRLTPVRVKLVHLNGASAPLPNEVISVQYGRDDRAERYSYQPDSAWYVDGRFAVNLTPGIYHLYLSMDGGGFYNSETAERNLGKCESYLKEIEKAIQVPAQEGGDIWRFKDQLSVRIDETKEINNLFLNGF